MLSARRILLSIWFLGALVCAAGPAAARPWPEPDALDAAVADALAGKQTRIEPRQPLRETGSPPPPLMVDTGPLGGFLELLTYLLLAAAAVLLITMLARQFAFRHERDGAGRAGGSDDADPEAEAPPEARVPDAAVVAAARGDFGEALRLLLGEVLPRFYRGKGRTWPEAWTSRQCLRRVAPGEPARLRLADLIAAVERHHFGGLPAVRSDWEDWERRVGELAPATVVEEAS